MGMMFIGSIAWQGVAARSNHTHSRFSKCYSKGDLAAILHKTAMAEAEVTVIC